MGNLEIMKYFSGVIFIGLEGIFILCFMYLYICAQLTLSVCVWRWSDNLLSGSRWFDRWARRCL